MCQLLLAEKVVLWQLGWSTFTGMTLGFDQILSLPLLVPLVSTLDSVQQAVRIPTFITSLIHMFYGLYLPVKVF
jgi:hypothetical protein